MLIDEGMVSIALFLLLSSRNGVGVAYISIIVYQVSDYQRYLDSKMSCIEPCTIVMDLEGTDGRERGEVIIILLLLLSYILTRHCSILNMKIL